MHEHLPGEQEPAAASFARLLLRTAVTLSLLLLTSWVWPLYLALAAVYGFAPNVPRLRQVRRYLVQAWILEPPPPGLSTYYRSWLTLSILQVVATAPVHGFAWLIDELIYGAALRQVRVEAPLIEMSAARSGSTQLARYLEGDPALVAPPFAQCLFPYLWLWRLVPATLGRFISAEQVEKRFESSTPLEFRQRHESHPFLTDTFDMALLGRHLNALSFALGPQIIVQDFSFGALAPHNRSLWQDDFVALFDGVARKTLLNADPGPDGHPRRLFIKGHFLCAADFLARKYPDAIFFTMIREPASRLQSAVNFLRVNPFTSQIGRRPPWAWLGAAMASSEASYCKIEQEWFTREQGPRRCVLRFSEYVRDLEGTMARLYDECLDTPSLPPHVPTEHTARERQRYLINRSLAELGIDEVALNERLADYVSWCRGA